MWLNLLRDEDPHFFYIFFLWNDSHFGDKPKKTKTAKNKNNDPDVCKTSM
jgi:hypothetical protein